MKKLVSIQEVSGEGLEALLGEEVLLMCMNYSYAGKLVGVNEKFVLLENCRIVYETGEWSAKAWKDAQKVGDKWYVSTASIESYGLGK